MINKSLIGTAWGCFIVLVEFVVIVGDTVVAVVVFKLVIVALLVVTDHIRFICGQ